MPYAAHSVTSTRWPGAWRGDCARVASKRGTPSRSNSELARSGRNVLRRDLSRCRRRAHRALLRPQGVGYILRRPNVKRSSPPPLRPPGLLAKPHLRCEDLPGLEWVAVGGDRTDGHLAPTTSRSRLGRERAASPRSRQSSRRAALVAYTSAPRRTRRCRALAPDDHRRDPTARRHAGESRRARDDHGCPGRAWHRHVGGAVGAGLQPHRDPPHRRVGPGRVLAAMLDDGLSAGQGSTFFLTSLLDHPTTSRSCTHRSCRSSARWCGRSAAAVGERCAAIGIEIARSFGSTEHPSITGPHHGAARQARDHGWNCYPASRYVWSTTTAKTSRSVCRARSGAEGRTSSSDTPTRSRPSGIQRRRWFMPATSAPRRRRLPDDHGPQRRTSSSAAAENISAQEIEELLVRMQHVSEVAVRRGARRPPGEVACAFLRMQPGEPAPDLGRYGLSSDAAGIARQKWPDHVRSSTTSAHCERESAEVRCCAGSYAGRGGCRATLRCERMLHPLKVVPLCWSRRDTAGPEIVRGTLARRPRRPSLASYEAAQP